MSKHEHLSNKELRARIERLSDELSELPLSSRHRRHTENLRAEYEHEIDVRAGLVDPGARLEVV